MAQVLRYTVRFLQLCFVRLTKSVTFVLTGIGSLWYDTPTAWETTVQRPFTFSLKNL